MNKKLTDAQKSEIKRDFKGSVQEMVEDYNNGWISTIEYTHKAFDVLADFMAPNYFIDANGEKDIDAEDYLFFDEMWREFISGEMFAE